MKIKNIIPIIAILIIGMLLAACTGGVGATTYPGLTVVGTTAYIASAGLVKAINLTDGTIPWQFPEDKADATRLYYATPIVTSDRVYIANYLGEIYALDLNGKAAWNAPFSGAKGRWYAAPVLCNNELFGGNGDGSFYAIKLDGTLDWQISKTSVKSQLPAEIPWGDFWSSAACDEKTGTLYQASLNHYFFAIDSASQKVVHYLDIKAPSITTPVINNGFVYFGTFNGDLYKINTADWHDITIKHLQGEIWAEPAFVNNALFIGTKTSTKTGKLYMLDVATLNEAATPTDTVAPVTTTGIALPDGLVFGTETGSFYKVNAKGEAFLWPNTITGTVFTDPVYANDKLWVAVFGSNDLLRYFNSAGNLSASFIIPAK